MMLVQFFAIGANCQTMLHLILYHVLVAKVYFDLCIMNAPYFFLGRNTSMGTIIVSPASTPDTT